MADNSYPQSKAELMTAIHREWTALMGVIDQLTPEQMTTPDAGGWSPKDNLAHVSTWMNFLRRSYLGGEPAAAVMDIDAQKYKELDEDGINAVIFERNRNRPAEEVLNELKDMYHQTVRTINQMNYADLMKPFRSDDPLQRPVVAWVTGNTSAHFAEHRSYIERVLRDGQA